MAYSMGPRRSVVMDVRSLRGKEGTETRREELEAFEFYDPVYRALCAVLFNFVPSSGHPGGSISSGRIVHEITYNLLDYDLSDPGSPGGDMVVYAAGHKVLGLFAA